MSDEYEAGGAWSGRNWVAAQARLDELEATYGVYHESTLIVLVQVLRVTVSEGGMLNCQLRIVEPLSPAAIGLAYGRLVFEVSTPREDWNQLWMFYPLYAKSDDQAVDEVRRHPRDREWLERRQRRRGGKRGERAKPERERPSLVYLWLCCEGWKRFGPFEWVVFDDKQDAYLAGPRGEVICQRDGDSWRTPESSRHWTTPLVTSQRKHPHPKNGGVLFR